MSIPPLARYALYLTDVLRRTREKQDAETKALFQRQAVLHKRADELKDTALALTKQAINQRDEARALLKRLVSKAEEMRHEIDVHVEPDPEWGEAIDQAHEAVAAWEKEP